MNPSAIPPATRTRSDGPAPTYQFVHPHYVGVCKVTASEGEEPEDILRYLNSPNTTGKSYCNFTSIRGGWQQLGAEKKDPTRASSALAPKPRVHPPR